MKGCEIHLSILLLSILIITTKFFGDQQDDFIQELPSKSIHHYNTSYRFDNDSLANEYVRDRLNSNDAPFFLGRTSCGAELSMVLDHAKGNEVK